MGNRMWLLVAGWGIVLGCTSVRHMQVTPVAPVTLTAEELRQTQAEGRKLAADQPRTAVRMTQAAQRLEQVAQSRPADYEVQWQAAEAWAFVAENDVLKSVRIDAAKHGIMLARQARKLQSDRVEGHYWYAITVGLLADADRSYGLKAVDEMEPALRRAIELDERYDFAGPLRVLGILLLRTPAAPVSIGSSRKGLRLLRHAVELFPEYPENWLYLAEACRDNAKLGEARQLLEKVLRAPLWPDRQFESDGWKTAARKLLQCVPSM